MFIWPKVATWVYVPYYSMSLYPWNFIEVPINQAQSLWHQLLHFRSSNSLLLKYEYSLFWKIYWEPNLFICFIQLQNLSLVRLVPLLPALFKTAQIDLCVKRIKFDESGSQ